jgi:hypothetical protein
MNYHIIASLSGEQDAQFAILTVTPALVAAVKSTRQHLAQLKAEHGGYPMMRLNGTAEIHFLKSFPEGWGFGHDLDQDPHTIEFPILIREFSPRMESFLAAAESTECYARSEATGLEITDHSCRIRGYQKHCDAPTTSEDINELISYQIIFDRHLHHILAALRCYQHQYGNPNLSMPSDFRAIATNNGEFERMNAEEIDTLCTHLNMGQIKLTA